MFVPDAAKRMSALVMVAAGTSVTGVDEEPAVSRSRAGFTLFSTSPAAVAELVDARRSGRRELTLVEVRVLSAA
jgi:hypothetical protein